MSDLEETFAYVLRCQANHFPPVKRQYRPLPPRKWTLDFAWPHHKIAVEIEGGVWVQGRHTRGTGYLADLEKHNALQLAHWLVIRCGASHLEDLSVLRWLEDAFRQRNAA